MVTSLINDEVKSLNGDHTKVFIGGFSQGGTAALAAFLLYGEGELGGCAVHSAANLAQIDYKSEVDLELKRRTEFMFYQGEADPTVTLDLVKRTIAVLDEYGLKYTLTTETDLKHCVS